MSLLTKENSCAIRSCILVTEFWTKFSFQHSNRPITISKIHGFCIFIDWHGFLACNTEMVFKVNNGSEWFYFWLSLLNLIVWFFLTSLFDSEWTSSIVNKANWQWEKIMSIPVRRLLVRALLMAMKRTVTPLTPWRSKLTSMPRKRKTREVANIRIKKGHTTTTSEGMKKYARKWCVSLFCLKSHHKKIKSTHRFICLFWQKRKRFIGREGLNVWFILFAFRKMCGDKSPFIVKQLILELSPWPP